MLTPTEMRYLQAGDLVQSEDGFFLQMLARSQSGLWFEHANGDETFLTWGEVERCKKGL